MPISGCEVDSFSCSVAISISLLMSLPRKSCGDKMRAEVRIVARIPFLIIDAVQNSGHSVRDARARRLACPCQAAYRKFRAHTSD